MRNTFIKLVFYFLLIIQSTSLDAQSKDTSNTKQKVSEVVQYRISLFKQKLNLSEAESTQFFPIYDTYIAELTKAKKNFRNKWKKKSVETLSEEEALEYYNDAIALQQKEVDLFKSCSEQLRGFMPMTKIIRLASVEKEVRTKLISKANEVKLPKTKKKSSPNNSQDVN